ncbi:MAG TPA: hypothetical protein VFE98_02995 [Candidatus Bathyarchaeia archaeon]|nr:hypothetical protein [Candidatus Bathyarchaeia archaeon]
MSQSENSQITFCPCGCGYGFIIVQAKVVPKWVQVKVVEHSALEEAKKPGEEPIRPRNTSK